MTNLRTLCSEMLEIAQKKVQEVQREDSIRREISGKVAAYLKEKGLRAVFVSESGRVPLSTIPEVTIAFIDIDSPGNFQRGGKVLPFCSGVAILDGPAPKFANCLAAGVVEHNSGKIWLAEKGFGASFAMGLSKTSGEKKISEGNLRIAGEGKMNLGSELLNVAGVSSGIFDLFSGDVSGGALAIGYRLIKEAKGAVIETDAGGDAGEIPFHFDEKYPVVCAATKELADEFLKKRETDRY
jgi:hypothetical protein